MTSHLTHLPFPLNSDFSAGQKKKSKRGEICTHRLQWKETWIPLFSLIYRKITSEKRETICAIDFGYFISKMARRPDLNSDFAQKLLGDIRVRKEKLGYTSSGQQSSNVSPSFSKYLC
jgi:hypothetical protein